MGPPLRIAVMGAGAVGCYYGAMLARAGYEVTLIGRKPLVEAVRDGGLLLETRDGEVRLALAASTQASAAAGAQVVLFCVKANDNERAACELAPHLAPGTLVLSLQNGVDNAERLSVLLGREVVAALVYVAVEMAAPGQVRHHGRGELVIGAGPASGVLAELFAAAAVQLTVSADLRGELWAKLIVNCVYNALSAIVALPYKQLVEAPGIQALMDEIVDECLAVAARERVCVASDIRERVRRIAQTMPGQFSSTAQDLARGKRSEIDHLNGYVARRAAALGLAAPANRLLCTLVHALEQRVAPPGVPT